MFGVSPESRFTPCVACGAWVPHGASEPHVCDGERVLDFRIFQLRGEIAAFDAQLAAWLSTARGRFAAWIAERDRLTGEASTYGCQSGSSGVCQREAREKIVEA